MTTATIEVDDVLAEDHPRRIVVITIAVLLPSGLNETDIDDLLPTAVILNGEGDEPLTDFIQTTVQDAHLVMT